MSICVALKERSRQIYQEHVLELFPNCVDSIVNATSPNEEIELVVADFCSTDWPIGQWLAERAKHLSVQTIILKEPFSRGRGRNCAASHARHDILLFLDADVLVTRELIHQSYDCAEQGKVFAPICRNLNRDGKLGLERKAAYGTIGVSRAVLQAVGNWPEFHSWGGEDTIVFERLACLTTCIRQAVSGFYHQWHPGDAWKHRYDTKAAGSDYISYPG